MTRTKQDWVNLAEIIDAYRIFPRIFFIAYIILFMWSGIWAMGLAELSIAQAGLVSTIIGAGAAWFKIYVSSGRQYK